MDLKELQTGNIVHVQTVMHEGTLTALRTKTGKDSNKDALTVAVDAYLRD